MVVSLVAVYLGVKYCQDEIREEQIAEMVTKAAERCDLKSVSVISVEKSRAEYGRTQYRCTIESSNLTDYDYSEMYAKRSSIFYYYNEECREQGKKELGELSVWCDKFICNGDIYEVESGSIKKNGEVMWKEERSATTTQTNMSTCTYKYFDGSICGAKTNKYSGLCDKHFEELYETYQSLGGTKVPKS